MSLSVVCWAEAGPGYHSCRGDRCSFAHIPQAKNLSYFIFEPTFFFLHCLFGTLCLRIVCRLSFTNSHTQTHTLAHTGFCNIAHLFDPILQHIPTWDPANQSHMQDALDQMGGHAKGGKRPRIISARRATKPALDLLHRLR